MAATAKPSDLALALVSSYDQYKEDTNTVASWLATTATSRGYPPGKLAVVTTGPTKTSTKNIVAIKDFTVLAKYISELGDPPVTAPTSFTDTLDRVIDLRSRYPAQMEACGMKTNQKSNARHSHFVDVLKEVRVWLKSCFPVQRPSTTADNNGDATILTNKDTTVLANGNTTVLTNEDTTILANDLGGLDISEISQEPPTTPKPVQAEPISLDDASSGEVTFDNGVQYEAEIKDEDETCMAYYLLMKDLRDFRHAIQCIWKGYDNNPHFDLVSAAVQTNTAIEFARNLIESAKGRMKAFPSCQQDEHPAEGFPLLQSIFFFEGKAINYRPQDLFLPGMEFNFKHFDYAEENSLLISQLLLHQLQRRLGDIPKDQVAMIPESLGVYNPAKNRQKMSGRKKFDEDFCLVAEFMSDQMIATRFRLKSKYPVEDEYLRGFKEFLEAGEPPFYLVFALQVFLDIHHLLREKASEGFDKMMRDLDSMAADLTAYNKLAKQAEDGGWSAESARPMVEMIVQVHQLRKDPVHPMKLKMFKLTGFKPKMPILPHLMLRRSPVMAGLMLSHFRDRMDKMDLKSALRSQL